MSAHSLRANASAADATAEIMRAVHRKDTQQEMKRWPRDHPLKTLEQSRDRSPQVEAHFARLALADGLRRQPPTVSRSEAEDDRGFAAQRCADGGMPALVTEATEGWAAQSWDWDGLSAALGDAMSLVTMGADSDAGATAGQPFLEAFQNRAQPESMVISQVPFDVQPELLRSFTEPLYVRGEVDIMGSLQSTGAVRSCAPYHRFVVATHPGGGVVLHRDAMGSAFWNVMLRGRKRWWLSEPWDEDALRVLEAIHPVDEQHKMLPDEWFLHVLPQIRNATEAGVLKLRWWDFEQASGEMVVVPAGGWWHLTVAFTHSTHISFNYMDEHGVEPAFGEICRRPPIGKRGIVHSLRLCQNLRVLQPEWYNRTCCPRFEEDPSSADWRRRALVEEKMEAPHWCLEDVV